MRPEDLKEQRILLSPLNWGMGHVSRCISLIHQLLEQKNTVFIACSSDQERVFAAYFSTIQFINHDDYPFSFKGFGNFELDLLKRFYPLMKRFQREKKEVDLLVNSYSIDCIISDHRYGFRTTNCHSIFLTHQLNLPVAWYGSWINRLHKHLIQRFNSVWIMDTANSTFAGKLSHLGKFKNVDFIGVYSRFSLSAPEEKTLPFVVIISGPEPYSKQFFDEQFLIAQKRTEKTVIITPKHYSLPTKNLAHIEIVVATDWKQTDIIISRAKKVISRAGYSTIMDIEILQIEAELSATPGQKEQEYLQNKHLKK